MLLALEGSLYYGYLVVITYPLIFYFLHYLVVGVFYTLSFIEFDNNVIQFILENSDLLVVAILFSVLISYDVEFTQLILQIEELFFLFFNVVFETIEFLFPLEDTFLLSKSNS